MLKRFKYIFVIMLLAATIRAAGDTPVIDAVCVNSTRHYRVDGEKNSTFQWILYDDVSGNTVSMTTALITAFTETTPEKYGSDLQITWDKPGTFRLEAIQYSEFGCDTLQQGIVKVYEHPEVTPGPPAFACAVQPIAIDGTTAMNYSLFKWETSGDGTFINGSTLTPTYTPGPNDVLAGTVTLTIRAQGLGDPGSCTEAVGTLTVTISNIQLAVTATDAKCFGGNDGGAKAELTGAYGATTFVWTGPNGFTGNQAELGGLMAGIYSVTVTDGNGCSATASVSVGEPSKLTANVLGTQVKCYGASDGTAVVNAAGGTGSYTYQWNDPAAQTSQTALGLAAGVYGITVTDANACTVTSSITISQPTLLVLGATASPVSCYGGSDGAATVTVSGGTATYTYLWNDLAAQKTATAGNLTAGTYVVTVTDANGCTATTSVTVDQPALLTATITGTNVKCFGGSDATATVNVVGGTASFTYQWNDPLNQTTQTATGLKTGTYQVKVTDANSCTASATITISQPTLLTASATAVAARCFGGSDGTATVLATGGTASYTYLWSDPLAQTAATAMGLNAGSYTVTVTDSNLCQATASVTITQPTAISIAEIHVDSRCSGNKPGSIDITVTGGTPGYTYAWLGTNGFTATTEDVSGLAGTQSYTVTVTDANGCTASSNIFINEEKNITLAETHQDIKCFGGINGSIDLEVKTGKKPYDYSWYNMKDLGTVISKLEDLTNLAAGTYRAVVVDGNGCDEDVTVVLVEPTKLVATASGSNVKCYAGNSGTATVLVSGGTATYTYQWNDPANQTTATATGLKAGTYTVTVTDANGCTTSASVTLTEPTQLMASVTKTDVNCYGGNNGSATVVASGGTAAYMYLWNDPASQTTATANNLLAGNYSVAITDFNGCSVSATVTVSQPAAPIVVLASVSDVKCNGGTDGTASSTVTGGTAPYSYIWNDSASQTTPVAVGLAAGTYQLRVTDAKGCTSSVTVTINQPALLAATVSATDVKCFGGSDGTITVTPSGGNTPYTYLWNDAKAQTTATAVGLMAGTYQVRVTDANGCAVTATHTLNQPSAPLAVSVNKTDVQCFGANDGQATALVSGGTAPYTYLWNDAMNQTTATAGNLQAGNYTVTVTDVNGCVASAAITIGQPTLLVASVSATSLKCFGGTDGTATVLVSGGTASYTYLWNDPAKQTTSTATGLTAGNYQVIATDAHGCTVSASVTVSQPAASLTATATAVPVKCFGGNDGAATVAASGGTATYTYLWNDPLAQTSATATGLRAGAYQVTVLDANGCTASASVTIAEPSQLSVQALGTDVKCFGGNDGTASATVSGGTPNYTYLWDDPAGQTTAVALGLKIGNYSVKVTDANGCVATSTVTINEPTELTASVLGVDVKCFGGNDGSATVLAQGGTMSYTYQWNDLAAQTTATAVNLKAGIYLVKVTDAHGCTVTASVTINEPSAALTAVISGADVKCNGGSDGTATVTVSGGTAPYTYLWTDAAAQTTAIATKLRAGYYEVAVTDKNGCSSTFNITINEPPAITATITKTDVNCFGGNDGSATVLASGGTGSFTYLWDDPLAQTTAKAVGLKANTYSVKVSDSNGCTLTVTITVNEPLAPLAATATGVNVKCFGGNDGRATVSVTGGTATYTYLWNDPAAQTGATATGLKAGNYQVTVTDANGCKITASVSITEPLLALSGTMTSTNVKCFGGNDGSATIAVTGGTVSYTYLWNDPLNQNTASANGLRAGNYHVLVTDANGCTFTSSATITEPPASLTASIADTPVSCYGGSDGKAIVTVSGGTPGYTYQWNDPATTTGTTVSGLTAGNYSVQVTDANACTTSASVTITQPAAPLAAAISGINVKCFGGSDGSATVLVTGGTTGYSYLWNDPAAQTTATAVNLKAGTYVVVVTDAKGCTTSATVTITEPPILAATLSGQDVKCYAGNDGSATVTVSGGTFPYTYLWNDLLAQTTSTATGLKAGNYQVIVTDSNGCKVTATITITQPVSPLITIASATPVKCFGGNDGAVSVLVSGGTATYTYLWNDPAAHTTSSVTGLQAGTYRVIVTDANGCTISTSVTVSEPPANLTVVASGVDVKCYGGKDGKATAVAAGGTPAYSYLWNDAASQTTATATALIAGNYKVVVTDANGCNASATVTIKQPLSIPTSTTSQTVCQNVLPFSWNGNSYSAGGTYSVTLTTKLGCDSIAVLKLQIEIPKVPVFAAIGPLCKGSVAPALPTASANGYTGTWSPANISTIAAGTTTYTFTPDAGQCATVATLAITVIEPVVPVFAAIGPLCINTTAPPLLPISMNNIPGTWSPAVISTNTTGTFSYTFTPAAGQCATTSALNVEITAPQAFAGLSETICPGSPYTLSGATAQNYSSLLWSGSGDGVFDVPTSLHPTYMPGPNDIASGLVTLTLTAQGMGSAPGCVPAVSSVALNIIQLDAKVAPSDVTCYGANDGTIIITAFGTGNFEYRVNGFGWQAKSQYKNLGPGTYAVDMRDTSIPTCIRTLATVTIVQPEPLSATVVPQDATCLGNDGIISVPSQDGGSGSYEYSLNDGPWTSTGYFTGLVPGNYHLDMRDLNVPTCTKDLGIWTIVMPTPISATLDKVDVSCATGNDGKIIISNPQHGSGQYEFNIGTGWSSQMTFENLTAGTYSVDMRDFNAKACAQPIGTIIIAEPQPLAATLVHKDITCHGRKDGSITIQNPSGGSGEFEFTIDGLTWGGTTSFNNLAPDRYYILMRDKKNPKCVISFLPIDIVEPLPLTATISKFDITCYGAHDGIITLSNPANGTPPYQYTINGTSWQPATSFSGLGTNTYTVEMNDVNGCKETLGSVFIIEPKPLTAVVDHTDETCKGNDGTISLSNWENSTSGLYEFSIDGGASWSSTSIFTGLVSKTYVVKIRDASLTTCEQKLKDQPIVAPVPLSATATPTNVTCYGANDGVISVKNPTGGSGLYEFTIDGSTWTSSTTIGNLSPAVYTLQMRDLKAITCELAVGTYTITQPEQLAGTASPTDVTCYGGKDGMISFSGAKGGSGSYEYSIDGVNWVSGKIDKLKADIYTVQMRDALVHSCIVTLGTVEVKEPEKITADVESTDVTCFGANDGTITINNTQNGVPPYQYSLNGVAPWQLSNLFTGVKAGVYDLIVVSDANNCVSTLAIVTIKEPEKLVAKYTSTNETTPGANDGTITIIGQKGGSGVYEYSKDGTTWQAGDAFTGLTPATYTILMRDANSITCSLALTITISPAGTLSAEYTITPVTCYGGLDGSITFKNPRGAAHYQFSIDNGNSWGVSDQFSFPGLAAQSYTLLVRDADNPANVAALATKDISQPTQLQAVVTVTPESFPGAKDGAITFSSEKGGSGVYDYSIDGSAWNTSNQFTGLPSGNYTVWIRDHNATICQVPYVRTIQPAGELIAEVTAVNVLCNGKNTGSILVTNASGAALIEYTVDGGTNWMRNNGVFNGLVAGSYDVKIRDANKTANTVSLGVFKITEPSELFAVFTNYVAPLCTGTFGSFSISASGGTPPYKGTGDFVLPTGVSKNYIVTDKNGCIATQYVSMPDPPKIVATAAIKVPKCFGDMGSVTISATGGTGALKGTGTFTVQAGKSYSFKVTDANGCSSNIISGVMPPEEMLAVTIVPLGSMCEGGGSIDLLVAATGGIPAYTGTGTKTVTFGTGATYTYTVTDSSGCTASKSITLKLQAPPAIPVLSVATQPTCTVPFGIIAVQSPLGPNYVYSIDGGTYTAATTFRALAPESSHKVKVKDITSGCESISEAVVIGPLPVLNISPELAVTQPGCIVPTGKIDVIDPAAGTGFEYRLDAGAYTSAVTFANLVQGSSHTVLVRNTVTGCISLPATATISYTPASPAAPVLALTATPTCDNPDGHVTVSSPVNSAGKKYSYSKDGANYQVSPVFIDLTGTTTYTITVRDDISGCTSSPTAIYVPAIPPPPVISVSGSNPRCYGDTYTITVKVNKIVTAEKTYTFDGVYTFYYDGGQFDNVKISGGTATITGQVTASRDFNNIRFSANGCTSTGTSTSVSIVTPQAIDLRVVQVTEQALKGTQMGAIDIDASGGNGLLKYLWSTGATTQDLNPISYGTYSVVVTDSRNCTATLSVKVPLNNPPVARPDNFATSCSVVSGNLLDDNGNGKDYDPDPAELKDFITINTVLVVKPSHAANYKVNSDGSFEYTALPNYTGDDILVYEIYDKLKQTATATVTIHIEADFDGDGIPDLADADADADGILNVDEVLPGQDWKKADYDGDGHPNWLDIDSDNDGIVDNVEAQPTAGYIAPSGKDVNHNGIDDAYDPLVGGVKLIPVNTDANLYMPDNLPDFLDVDSDNDHVPDYIEGHDQNGDGKIDTGHFITGKDSDADGLDDAWDTIVNGCNNFNSTGSNAYIQDFDGDGIRDWRDDNDDDDEYPTRLEDLNADGDYSNDVTGHVGHPEYLWYGRDCELFIPDAFSPNDDNIHDYFQIYCIEMYPNAKMYIFDQQGNKLFEKDHYGNVDYWGTPEKAWWDGTTTNRVAAVNGRKVVPGTYYYVLKLGNGETKKSFVFVSY